MRNPIDLFKGALTIMQDNLALFIGILLLPIIVSIITTLFTPSQATGVFDTMEWSVYIAFLLISLVVNVLMYVAIVLAIDNRSMTVMGAYKSAMAFFWSYLGLTIVTGVILFIGFLLLIIPGIILSVWFAFSTFVLVLEKSSITDALRRSREYVRGRWWGVFGRLIAMSLVLVLLSIIISGVLMFIPSVIVANALISGLTMLLAPLGVAYIYLMYQDISGHAVAPTASVSMEPIEGN